MVILFFILDLEDNPDYLRMISEAETNSPRRKSAETLKQPQDSVHRDRLEDDEFVNKVCTFELISRGKNSQTVKSPTAKSPGKISISSPDSRSGRLSGENFAFPQGYAGEKLFSKDTATTRVSASILQGKSPSKDQTEVQDINANSIGSFGSVSTRRKSGESRNSSASVKSKSSTKSEEVGSPSPRILGTHSADPFFNTSVSPIRKTPLISSPFQSKSKPTSSEKANPGKAVVVDTITKIGPPKTGADHVTSANVNRSNSNEVKVNGIISGNNYLKVENDPNSSHSRNTFEGLDIDFNELTESQKDLTLRHREIVAERKQEQKMEKQEKQRLEEILNMCAEYERQIEDEQNRIKSDKHTVVGHVSKKNETVSPPIPPLPLQYQHLQNNQVQSNTKAQVHLTIGSDSDKATEFCVKSREPLDLTQNSAANQRLVQAPKDLELNADSGTMSLDRRDKSEYRSSMTKIMTNGSLTMLSSPSNPHKDFLHGFQIRRAGSNSSNSEEESLTGSSEDTGTIKRRPSSNHSPLGSDRPKSPRTSPRSPIPARNSNQSNTTYSKQTSPSYSFENKSQHSPSVFPPTKTIDNSSASSPVLKLPENSLSSKESAGATSGFDAKSFRIEPLRLTNVSVEVVDNENHNSFEDSSHSSTYSEPECDIHQTQDKIADLHIHEPVTAKHPKVTEKEFDNKTAGTEPKNQIDYIGDDDPFSETGVRTSEPEALANLNLEIQTHRQVKASKKYHDYVNINGSQYSDSNSTGSSSSNTIVHSGSNGFTGNTLSNISPRSSGSDTKSSSMENITPINSDSETPSLVKRNSVRTSSTGTTDSSSECSWGALEVGTKIKPSYAL